MNIFPYDEPKHAIYCPQCGRKLDSDGLCVCCGFTISDEAIPHNSSKGTLSTRGAVPAILGVLGFIIFVFILGAIL